METSSQGRPSEQERLAEQQAVVATFWEKAKQAVAENEREEARAWMEGVIELDDGNVEAWLFLADLIPTGRAQLACYARVLEISPGNAEAKAGIRSGARRSRRAGRSR